MEEVNSKRTKNRRAIPPAPQGEPVSLIEISGSHGVLTVDRETGAVIDRSRYADAVGSGYSDVHRVDVEEWAAYYGHKPETGKEYDILDFGYWVDGGGFDEPCHHWRLNRDRRHKNITT